MGSGLFISRARLITEQSPQGAFTLARPCTTYERNRISQSHFPVSVARPCRDGYVRHFIAVLSAIASAYPRLTAALVQPSSDAHGGIFGKFVRLRLAWSERPTEHPHPAVWRLPFNSTAADPALRSHCNRPNGRQSTMLFAIRRILHHRTRKSGGAVPAFAFDSQDHYWADLGSLLSAHSLSRTRRATGRLPDCRDYLMEVAGRDLPLSAPILCDTMQNFFNRTPPTATE